jgi:hypothetical protein
MRTRILLCMTMINKHHSSAPRVLGATRRRFSCACRIAYHLSIGRGMCRAADCLLLLFARGADLNARFPDEPRAIYTQ